MKTVSTFRGMVFGLLLAAIAGVAVGYTYDELSGYLLRLGKDGTVKITASANTATLYDNLSVVSNLTAGGVAVAKTPQSDTNATTLLTAYTPRAIGDVLVGQFQSTNRIWIATGVATSSWLKVDNQ